MKNPSIAQRTLSLLLSMGMLVSMSPVQALAEELGIEEPVAIEQVVEEAEAEEAEDEELVAAEELPVEAEELAAEAEETAAADELPTEAEEVPEEQDVEADPIEEQTAVAQPKKGSELASNTAITAEPELVAQANGGRLYVNSGWNWFHHAANTHDEFTLTLSKAGKLDLTFWANYSHARISVWNPDRTIRYFNEDIGGTEQNPKTVQDWAWMDKGSYIVLITGWNIDSDTSYNYEGDYKIKLDFASVGTTETESNDDFDHANALEKDTEVKGMFDYTGYNQASDVDFYRISVPYKQKVTFRLTRRSTNGTWGPTLSSFFLDIFDSNYVNRYDSNRPSDYERHTEGDYVKVYSMTLPAGTYYVRLYEHYNYHHGPYSFSWSIATNKKANPIKATPASKTLVAKAPVKRGKTTKAVAISAGIKVAGAQGKVTYAKIGGSTKVKVNAKNSKITVAKGIKAGTKLTVKIRVKAAGNSKFKPASKTVTRTIVVRKK